MGSVLGFIKRELSQIENLVLIVIAIFIYVLKIIISVRGTNTPWFKSLKGQEFVNPITSGLTWIFAYLTSILGLIVLSYQERGWDTIYIAGLYMVGLVFSLGWDVIFFYGRDIKFSLIIYVFLVLYYAWFFYEVFQRSRIAAFFEVFLLLRSIYFFFQIGRLLIDNPQDTIIPF